MAAVAADKEAVLMRVKDRLRPEYDATQTAGYRDVQAWFAFCMFSLHRQHLPNIAEHNKKCLLIFMSLTWHILSSCTCGCRMLLHGGCWWTDTFVRYNLSSLILLA